MYVRWRRYRGKPKYVNSAWLPGISHRAYLVRSARVEGRPRQQLVRYLGSIRDFLIVHPFPDYRARFWRDVRHNLDEVELDAATRARCEAAIAAVVPPVTPEEEAKIQERRKIAMALLRSD